MRRYIRSYQLLEKFGVSRQTIWRLCREGKFPRPITLTDGGAIFWDEDEVDQFIKERRNSRGGAVTPPKAA
jgi:predicted DNA-binding transcriptional regulator AlpA